MTPGAGRSPLARSPSAQAEPERRARGPAASKRPRFLRPTWAEVDLGALKSNLDKLRRLTRTELLFVVKADAYGHGAVECARAAVAARACRRLGVSSVEEGIALRRAGLRVPILILGSLYPFESALEAVRHGLTPTVASLEGARRLAELAEGSRRPLRCHLKLDTGMGRIGVRWPSGLEVVEFLARAKGVRLEGVYTHLACADSDPGYTALQLGRFRGAVEQIERAGLGKLLRHAANSAAALRFPDSRWDLVRPGLAAYGLWPGFEPVLSLKTRIVFLKNVEAGTPLGYGAAYRTSKATRIATLPIGYADGLPRIISRPGARPAPEVLVRGRRCPIVGTMSMDMTLADVGAVRDAHVGDEVVVIGASGRERVTAGALAEAASTIPYEIVSGLKARVPRVYL